MKTVFKILKKVVLIGLGVYAALFAVFFFDLDGKALFYGVLQNELIHKIYLLLLVIIKP